MPEPPTATKKKDPTQREQLSTLLDGLDKLNSRFDALEQRLEALYVVEADALAGAIDEKIQELRNLASTMQNGARLQLDEDSVRELAAAFRADMLHAIREGDFVGQIASGVRSQVATATAKKVVDEVKAKTGDKGTKIAIWIAAAGVVTIIAGAAYAVAGYEPPVVDGVAVETPANAA